MHSDQLPASWVGEDVEVATVYGGGGTQSGKLIALSELGAVLETESKERETGTQEGRTIITTHHTFYPWTTVGWVSKTVQK
jgi:hypothetical protein